MRHLVAVTVLCVLCSRSIHLSKMLDCWIYAGLEMVESVTA